MGRSLFSGGGPPGRYVPEGASWSVRAVVGLSKSGDGVESALEEAHRAEAETVDLGRLGRLAAVDLGDAAADTGETVAFARKLRADLANMLRFLAHVKRDQGLEGVRPMWSPMDARAVRLRDGEEEAGGPHADTIPQDDLLRLPRRVWGNLYYVPTASGRAAAPAGEREGGEGSEDG